MYTECVVIVQASFGLYGTYYPSSEILSSFLPVIFIYNYAMTFDLKTTPQQELFYIGQIILQFEKYPQKN